MRVVSGKVGSGEVWSGKVLSFAMGLLSACDRLAMGLLSACHRLAAPLLPASDLASNMAAIFFDDVFHCLVRVSFSNHLPSELTLNICRTSFSIRFHSRALLHMAKP